MEWSLAHGNGVLSTAGDVLFIGQPDGNLLGLDAETGERDWRFQAGAGLHTQPDAYQIDGEQYAAVLAGGNVLPYDSPRGDHLWAFKLGGTVAPSTPPVPPLHRQPISAEEVDGAITNNTIVLGRAWSNNALVWRRLGLLMPLRPRSCA